MHHLNLCFGPLTDGPESPRLSIDQMNNHYFKLLSEKNEGIPDSNQTEIRNKDSLVSSSCYEHFLLQLTSALNTLHQTSHTQRYWEILIGHWLQTFVDIVINRTSKIENILDAFEVSKISRHEAPFGYLTPQNTGDLIQLSNNVSWDSVLYSRMISSFGINGTIKVINRDLPEDIKLRFQSSYLGIHSGPSRAALNWLRVRVTPFSRNFIISTYLPRKIEWLLSLRFASFPQAGKIPLPITHIPISTTLRNGLREAIGKDSDNSIQGKIRELMPEMLPTIFLEGYPELVKTSQKKYLPKNPKFIFTSNEFHTNEVFKVWVAESIEQGTKYIVGQHGNNYGTIKYPKQSIEERTADAFLTWGWVSSQNNIPTFNFKNPKGSSLKHNRQGKLLLTQIHFPHNISFWDSIADYFKDLKSQMDFVSYLPESIRDETLVRLHPASQSFSFDEKGAWRGSFPSISIDSGQNSLTSLITNSRIIVHGYDSTGLLESLSANYPTICFMPGGFWNVREDALDVYEKLKQVGILQTSAFELSEKVTQIWEDIPSWWLSREVQSVREEFCCKYSKSEIAPFRRIANVIATQVK